jgi:hypothetical protein
MSVADEVLVVQDLWICGFYELPATTDIDDQFHSYGTERFIDKRKGREILHSVDDAGLYNQKSISLKRFCILWQCAMLLESMLHGLPHPRYTI